MHMSAAYPGEHLLYRMLTGEIERAGGIPDSTLARARRVMSRPLAVHFEEMRRGTEYDFTRVVGEWRRNGRASREFLESVMFRDNPRPWLRRWNLTVGRDVDSRHWTTVVRETHEGEQWTERFETAADPVSDVDSMLAVAGWLPEALLSHEVLDGAEGDHE